jgi:hypothetical protein
VSSLAGKIEMFASFSRSCQSVVIVSRVITFLSVFDFFFLLPLSLFQFVYNVFALPDVLVFLALIVRMAVVAARLPLDVSDSSAYGLLSLAQTGCIVCWLECVWFAE